MKFLTQTLYGSIHCPDPAHKIVPPGLAEQLFPGEDSPAIEDQMLDQIKLQTGECQRNFV